MVSSVRVASPERAKTRVTSCFETCVTAAQEGEATVRELLLLQLLKFGTRENAAPWQTLPGSLQKAIIRENLESTPGSGSLH